MIRRLTLYGVIVFVTAWITYSFTNVLTSWLAGTIV